MPILPPSHDDLTLTVSRDVSAVPMALLFSVLEIVTSHWAASSVVGVYVGNTCLAVFLVGTQREPGSATPLYIVRLPPPSLPPSVPLISPQLHV
jgi:hypothetical protein